MDFVSTTEELRASAEDAGHGRQASADGAARTVAPDATTATEMAAQRLGLQSYAAPTTPELEVPLIELVVAEAVAVFT
jgi:hypothetical protein